MGRVFARIECHLSERWLFDYRVEMALLDSVKLNLGHHSNQVFSFMSYFKLAGLLTHK
jgi:hypothetical protein